MKKYIINQNFFKNISEEIPSYWLGFLMVRGYIYDKNGYLLRCQLNSRDIGHLYVLAKDLHTTKQPIRKGSRARLDIKNKAIIKDLLRNGFNSEIPDLIHKRHWLRGVVDGLGVMTSCNHNLRVNISHHDIEFIQRIKELTKHKASIHIKKYKTSRLIYMISFIGKDAISLCKDLYLNQSRCMKRKFDKISTHILNAHSATLPIPSPSSTTAF